MNIKTVEIRDSATFIPALAIRLGPGSEADRYLCARAGFGRTEVEQSRFVILWRLNGGPAEYDPFAWSNRTMQTAHRWLMEHWIEIVSGDVVDVEYILGERDAPKQSEALTNEGSWV